MSIAIIIMASGLSRRMGVNKLLLPVLGKPLCGHIIDTAIKTGYRVVVVSCYDEVLSIAGECGATAVFNGEAEAGQSRSIRLGLKTATACDAAIFCPADQPFISVATLHGLTEEFCRTGKIVTASYGGQSGSPVLFPRAYFEKLSSLTGDMGGRAVIKEHPNETTSYAVHDLSEGFDIDDENDLLTLANQNISSRL